MHFERGIEIAAAPETVWPVVSDIERWHEWTASITSVEIIDGRPLAVDHGGPVRMVVPELWAWKGAKWINRLEFLTHDRRGYWEIRGYSNTAHPWRDDRMW